MSVERIDESSGDEKSFSGEEIPTGGLATTVTFLARRWLGNFKQSPEIWTVLPGYGGDSSAELSRAKELIEEAERLGVRLPQEAENVLENCFLEEDYRTRFRACYLLQLIGLRIPEVRQVDEKFRQETGKPRVIHQWADELELGSLDPTRFLNEYNLPRD